MGIIDRHTALKWAEKCDNLRDDLRDGLLGVYSNCTSTTRRKATSFCLLLAMLAGAGYLFYMVKPGSAAPFAPQMVLKATDAAGDAWAMNYLPSQDVAAISNSAIEPGGPLTLTVKLERRQSELLILPEITGTAAERYFPGILKNGQWQQPPMLLISDSQDRPLHQGRFKYG